MSVEQILRQASGPSRVYAAHLKLGSAWTKNDTDYWTILLYVRRVGEETGHALGDPLSLRTKSIAARTLVRLYNGRDVGTDLADGDEVVAVVDRVGSPVALSCARIILDWETRAK